MAKKRKLPKKPRQGAPLSTWERYEKKRKEVEDYNKQLEKDKAKKEAIIRKYR